MLFISEKKAESFHIPPILAFYPREKNVWHSKKIKSRREKQKKTKKQKFRSTNKFSGTFVKNGYPSIATIFQRSFSFKNVEQNCKTLLNKKNFEKFWQSERNMTTAHRVSEHGKKARNY